MLRFQSGQFALFSKCYMLITGQQQTTSKVLRQTDNCFHNLYQYAADSLAHRKISCTLANQNRVGWGSMVLKTQELKRDFLVSRSEELWHNNMHYTLYNPKLSRKYGHFKIQTRLSYTSYYHFLIKKVFLHCCINVLISDCKLKHTQAIYSSLPTLTIT